MRSLTYRQKKSALLGDLSKTLLRQQTAAESISRITLTLSPSWDCRPGPYRESGTSPQVLCSWQRVLAHWVGKMCVLLCFGRGLPYMCAPATAVYPWSLRVIDIGV